MDLQYFVNFCCRARWPSYIYMSILFSLFFFWSVILLISSQLHMMTILLLTFPSIFFFSFSLIPLGDSLGCIAINFPVITPLGASHRFGKAVFSLPFSLRCFDFPFDFLIGFLLPCMYPSMHTSFTHFIKEWFPCFSIGIWVHATTMENSREVT